MKLNREYIIPISIIFIVLGFSYLVQTKYCFSSLKYTTEVWEEVFSMRERFFPYYIRLFVSYPLLFLKNYFSVPIEKSFPVFQYSLFIITSIIFYNYLKVLKFSKIFSNIGLFLFLTAFPVFCAFIEPVHTFDDVWVYLLLNIVMIYILQNKIEYGMIFLTLSCFAREQSILFYPIILAGALWLNSRKLDLKTVLWLIVPIILYIFYYFLLRENPDSKRFEQIYFNFETFIRGRDTVFSVFISFGSIWLLALISLFKLVNKNKTPQEKFLFWSAIYFTIVTVMVTLFFTRARETRILFPPFIFLIPFALNEIKKLISILSSLKSKTLFLLLGSCSYVLTEIGLDLAYVLIPEFEYRVCPETAHISLGIHLSVIFIILEIFLLNFYGYIRNKLRLTKKSS